MFPLVHKCFPDCLGNCIKSAVHSRPDPCSCIAACAQLILLTVSWTVSRICVATPVAHSLSEGRSYPPNQALALSGDRVCGALDRRPHIERAPSAPPSTPVKIAMRDIISAHSV